MTPRMQLGGAPNTNAKGSSADLNGDLSKFSGDSRDFARDNKMNYNTRKLGDTRQGNISVEIWKRAFTDALKRLCPLQGEGLECGCLPALNRMVSLRGALWLMSEILDLPCQTGIFNAFGFTLFTMFDFSTRKTTP